MFFACANLSFIEIWEMSYLILSFYCLFQLISFNLLRNNQ